MGLVVLGCHPAVFRQTDEWYVSHYYTVSEFCPTQAALSALSGTSGIAAMAFIVASVAEIWQIKAAAAAVGLKYDYAKDRSASLQSAGH